MKRSYLISVTCEKTEKRNKSGRVVDTGDPQLSKLKFYPLTQPPVIKPDIKALNPFSKRYRAISHNIV